VGVDLHVVHVGEPNVPRPNQEYDPERARETAKERAVGIANKTARDAGIEGYEPVGLVGEPVEVILGYSEERDVEYIVVSARKRSPLGQAVFGSVTQSLLLNADRPIVAVPHASD
jgi:nucleotide-binding universal stress UspA family protein